MINKKATIGFVILTAAVQWIRGQSTFQNLDFESANLSPVPAGQYGGPVSITDALPGWSAELGNTPVTQVVQNDYSLGSASIDIFGPTWNSVNPGIIDGSYTVFLQAGVGPGLVPLSASLFQDGTIPANEQSLTFTAWNMQGPAPPSVSFAGNTLPLVELSSGQAPNGQLYNVYGANIAAYAGQTGELDFTATYYNWIELDDIAFSAAAVPEPNPLVLSGIGGLLFAAYRRFAPKRR